MNMKCLARQYFLLYLVFGSVYRGSFDEGLSDPSVTVAEESRTSSTSASPTFLRNIQHSNFNLSVCIDSYIHIYTQN